jgi:transposase
MKKTPGKNDAAKERYWTKIIEEARKYPKGVTEYCRVMNVEKPTYYFWFKRLRPKHPEWHDLTNHPEVLDPNRRDKGQKNRHQDQQLTNGAQPDTEVTVKARRRKWSAADRERILKEFDRLQGADLAAALRREGLYVHTLTKWRTERDLKEIAQNANRAKGPNPLAAENKKLKEEIARLEKKLQQSGEIIQLQKKISEMLGMALDAIDEQ